jgi:Transcriptional regulators
MANIRDVAKLAGHSVSTVSRVLNQKGYVAEETKKKSKKRWINLIIIEMILLVL